MRNITINTKDLIALKAELEIVATLVACNSAEKERYREPVQEALLKLQQSYEKCRHDESPSGMLRRNDILEALSIAYRRTNSLNELLGLNVERIKASPATTQEKPIREQDIVVVDFSDRTAAVERIQAASRKGLSLPELKEQLGPLLKKENVPMGRMIDLMYEHEVMNSDKLKAVTTAYMGFKQGLSTTPMSTAKFFKGLGITVENAFNGELYAYSEVFTTEFRKEKSHDTAFQRALTPLAEEILLKDARAQQEEINRSGGGGNLVISNSYNRLSVHQIEKGGASKKFNITGKLLASSKENSQAAKHEKGYTGSFSFSLKNMFGSEDNAETTITQVIQAEKLDSRSADRLLLDCLTNMADREAWLMVVQRLAPEDIHHYAASVEGRVLSREESAAALRQMLREDHPEAAQLRELEKVFAAQSEEEKERATLNIQGTQSSVSRKALYSHSEILANNDRKVVLVEHKGGGLSINTYIGATGVNNVDVTATRGKQSLGADVGSMGFGNDKGNRSTWQQGLATREASIALRAKAGDQLSLGQDKGAFHQSGSTVVSLYLSRDIALTKELKDFDEHVRIKITKKLSLMARVYNVFWSLIGRFFGMKKVEPPTISRAVEVKAKLGDVIALPKTYLAIQEIKSVIGQDRLDHLMTSGKSKEEILKDIWSTFGANCPSTNSEILQSLRLSTEEERYYIQRVEEALERVMES